MKLSRIVFPLASCLAVFAGLATQQAGAVLVHHWEVEGDTAGTLSDSVGSVDLFYDDPGEGSVSTAAAAPGIGSAQGFTTATGGDATSANPDDLFMATSFSLAMWTQRVEATGNSHPALLGVFETTENGGYNHNYLLRSASDGTGLTFFSRDDSGNTIALGSSVDLSDLGWHHVAATFDWSGTTGSAATAKIYVDGVETGTTTATSWGGWTASDQTQGGIGEDTFTPVSNYDDIRIYDNILTPAEISDLAVSSLVTTLGLEVNTTTGEVTLVNGIGVPVDIDYYEIRSATGDLVVGGNAPGDFDGNGIVAGNDFLNWQRGESPAPLSAADLAEWEANYSNTGGGGASWNSLQDQDLAGFPAGDGSGNGWEEGENVDDSLLQETFLLGSSVLPVDADISLGNAFAVGGTEGLVFEYHITGAGANQFVTGTVSFVSSLTSSVVSVPEPTTLTISFLCFVALCGKSRRFVANREC